jgi:hypothetical protein
MDFVGNWAFVPVGAPQVDSVTFTFRLDRKAEARWPRLYLSSSENGLTSRHRNAHEICSHLDS